MVIEVTPQNIITASALAGAAAALIAYFAKGLRWFDRQKKQDHEIKSLRDKHEDDMLQLNEELTLLTYGILACLKGLHEQGCNDSVTTTIADIEQYLNKKAHRG